MAKCGPPSEPGRPEGTYHTGRRPPDWWPPFAIHLPPCLVLPVPPVASHPWHRTDHHTAAGFRSPWQVKADEVPPLKAAQWLLSFAFQGRPREEPAPFRLLDPAELRPASEGDLRLAWLGHSTFSLHWGGLHVLTDPVFAERVSPLAFAGPQRQVPLPLDLDALPRVDLILLSHDHYDHLDLDAIARLHERDRPLALVPLGLKRRLGEARAVELDWGQYADLHRPDGPAFARVHCTPAKHFSGRTALDRDRTLWASWYLEPLPAPEADPVVATRPSRLYFAGDSGYAPHFTEIRERLGAPEVVLLPIGAYEPRWFMRRVHLDPVEAVQAFIDLGGLENGAHLVPTHWGTFPLTEEPLDEPPRRLREAAEAARVNTDRVHLLPVGGVLEL
jgi:N-acyl-phosphatidylethanolamine-hydrolysing phospholipase D